MAQNLDPQTAGLDLAPQVWQVPKLGMMEMQIQEYKDQQAAKKAAGAQKLIGDIDLKNVHPAHLADLQKKLDGLYDVAVQAYSSKDPALMKQLQAKKNELNIGVGHSQVAWNQTQKLSMDYIQNPDKYGLTQEQYNAAIAINMQPRSLDVNNLSLQNDVPDIPTVLGATGKGYLEIANFNDEAYKTNFVDVNTGKISAKNRNGMTRRQMSDNMFIANMNESEGENRERLLRDYYLTSIGREGDTRLKFDARDQRAMDAWIQQHPDFEEEAMKWGAQQHYEELERRLGEKRIPDGAGSKPSKFKDFIGQEYTSAAEWSSSLGSSTFKVPTTLSGTVSSVPLGDNKLATKDGMISDVIYDATSKNANQPKGYIIYKASDKLLKAVMDAQQQIDEAGDDEDKLAKATAVHEAALMALQSDLKEPEYVDLTQSNPKGGGWATFWNSLTVDERKDFQNSVNSNVLN